MITLGSTFRPRAKDHQESGSFNTDPRDAELVARQPGRAVLYQRARGCFTTCSKLRIIVYFWQCYGICWPFDRF